MAVNQHIYGSGEVSFAVFGTGTTTPGARRYIGNTSEFTLTSEQEALDHFDSDHGIRVRNGSVVTSFDQGGNIVTDNINRENVAMFFLGTSSIVTTGSATGTIENITAISFGTYQLGLTALVPTGVRKVTNVVVTNTGSTVTYISGTDYLVDLAAGTVTFIEGGTIAAGNPAKITYNTSASTREQVISGNLTIEGALHFKAFNASGPQRDYYFPWVKLTPNGNFDLKGEDWQTLPFNVEVLKLGSLAAVYSDGVAT